MLALANVCVAYHLLWEAVMTDKKGKSGGQSEDKTLIRKDEGARHGGVQDKHTVDDTHQPPQAPPPKPSKTKEGES